jgi:hypothetical protein
MPDTGCVQLLLLVFKRNCTSQIIYANASEFGVQSVNYSNYVYRGTFVIITILAFVSCHRTGSSRAVPYLQTAPSSASFYIGPSMETYGRYKSRGPGFDSRA